MERRVLPPPCRLQYPGVYTNERSSPEQTAGTDAPAALGSLLTRAGPRPSTLFSADKPLSMSCRADFPTQFPLSRKKLISGSKQASKRGDLIIVQRIAHYNWVMC